MSFLDLALANILSPAILCFALGAFGAAVRSDLRLPDAVASGLAIYLLLAIGIRGGAELSEAPFGRIVGPVAVALLLGVAIPVWCYAILRRLLGLSVADAAALSAHYGSVSAVTFAAVTAMLDSRGTPFEGYAAALLAIMEAPAIVVAIGLARATEAAAAPGQAGGASRPGTGFSVLLPVLSSKSVLLLAGGLLVGAAAGPASLAKVKPVFGDLFPGALCLFLLELGRVAASRAGDFAAVGVRLAAFAILMPIAHGAIGVLLGHAAGMSQGGAAILGTLAASASYIAAPAAVRSALPDANPGYYLTCSLAITFPFNIVFGLPLYDALARSLSG